MSKGGLVLPTASSPQALCPCNDVVVSSTGSWELVSVSLFLPGKLPLDWTWFHDCCTS